MGKLATVTMSKEVLVNLGNYENVKAIATVSQEVPSGDIKDALAELSDLTSDQLAYEVRTLGANPNKYGLE